MTGFQSKRKMGLSRMGDEVQQSPREEDYGLNRVKGWELKMCWRPWTCFLTGKQLWGRRAYHGVRVLTGPGDPIYENYWIDKHKFIMWNLTRT
jgi:hypothetical protein